MNRATILIFVSLCLLQSISCGTLQTLKPTKVGQFVRSNPDVVLLICSGERCDLARSIYKLVVNDDMIAADVPIVYGFFDSISTYSSIASTVSSSGSDLVYYVDGKKHASISIYDIDEMSDVIDFIEGSSKKLLPEVGSVQELEEQVSTCAGEYSTVLYFAENPDLSIVTFLLRFELEYGRIFQVFYVPEKLRKQAGIDSNDVIKVYQCYDHVLTKDFSYDVKDFAKDIDELEDWILKRGTPLVTRISRENLSAKLDIYNQAIIVAIPERNQDEIIQQITAVAKRVTDIGFLWGPEEELKERFIDSGATGNVFPTAIAIKSLKEMPIVWNEKHSLSESSLRKWAEDLLAGKVEPFKKSAPIPKQSNDQVQSLVFDNFASTVEKSKNPLVIFFDGKDSACEGCYSSRKIFEEVAAEFKNRKISFYNYNIAENYIPLALQSVPDIYLYKNGEIIRYNDATTNIAKLKGFLKDQLPKIHDEL